MTTKKEETKREHYVFGDLAAILSTLALLPYVAHVTVTKDVRSVHYLWIILQSTACFCWFYYGYQIKSTPNMFAAVAIFILVIYLTIFKHVVRSK